MEYSLDVARSVALELKSKAIDAYAEILGIFSAVQGWDLQCSWTRMPTPYEIRIQIEAYQALKIQALDLRAWSDALKTAQPADGYIAIAPCGDAAASLPPEVSSTTGLTISSATGITFTQ